MTLLQLKYVLTIAETGSMNEAARQLFVSQPTLTGAVKEIENEIGIRIFDRSNKGVRLTHDGEEFLEYASSVVSQFELLESKYRDTGISRHFAVSAQHYPFVVKAFSETVRQFGTEGFSFTLRETTTRDVLHEVASGRSNIGILYRSVQNERILARLMTEQELQFTPLVSCPICVLLFRDHPLADRALITGQDLDAYPYLRFEQRRETIAFFSEELDISYSQNRTVTVTDRATMQDLARTLHGYTLGSGLQIQFAKKDDLMAVPYTSLPGKEADQMELGYITKSGFVEDAVSGAFLTALRANAVI